MRAVGLWFLFVIGFLVAFVFVAWFIFLRSLIKGKRAFHPFGSVCRVEIVALDDKVGPRIAGSGRVRFASSTAKENAPDPSIIGFGIKIGDGPVEPGSTSRRQDLAAATFESFFKLSEAPGKTNVADYMMNQYGSVAPWRDRDLGVMWFRLIPDPASNVPKTGLRTERLDADIAAGRANFTLESREGPGPDGKVRAQLAQIKIVERLPDDDPKFHISMWRSGRGISATGFRNGLRSVLYPVSQFARGLRGG